MNFVERWFLKQSKKAWEHAAEENRSGKHPTPAQKDDPLARIPNSNIRIYKANGGLIVEISSYDINHDKWYRELYVIPDGGKITEDLTSILVQHSLKNPMIT